MIKELCISLCWELAEIAKIITDDLLQIRMMVLSHAWRDGRAAEGAPLLREYGVKNSIEGSNPSLSAIDIVAVFSK